MKKTTKLVLLVLSLAALLCAAGCGKRGAEVSDVDLVESGAEVSDVDMKDYKKWQKKTEGLDGVWKAGDYLLELLPTDGEGYWSAAVYQRGEKQFDGILFWSFDVDPVLSYADSSASSGARISYLQLTVDGDELELVLQEGDALLGLKAGESVLLERKEE